MQKTEQRYDTVESHTEQLVDYIMEPVLVTGEYRAGMKCQQLL